MAETKSPARAADDHGAEQAAVFYKITSEMKR